VDSITRVPAPVNEPVLDYAPGSPERAALNAALADLASRPAELPHVIGGRAVTGTGAPVEVRSPHDHKLLLGTLRNATTDDAHAAVAAARAAAPAWRALPFDERAAVFLRAADLLAGPWRQPQRRHHARPVQDVVPGRDRCGLRADRLLAVQRPLRPPGARRAAAANSPGIWNRTDHRPLEGFVYAITPFNFTAIAATCPPRRR
jgi:1-pyrroline-5-carboxylate dehydrogenase